MNEARTIAWILYALGLASQTKPAKFADISGVADGINHAIPTHKEMQISLKWLVANGLAQKEGFSYSLTPDGLLVLSSARTENSTTLAVWAALTKVVAKQPAT